jgi:hypothetical protein
VNDDDDDGDDDDGDDGDDDEDDQPSSVISRHRKSSSMFRIVSFNMTLRSPYYQANILKPVHDIDHQQVLILIMKIFRENHTYITYIYSIFLIPHVSTCEFFIARFNIKYAGIILITVRGFTYLLFFNHTIGMIG